MAFLEHQVGHHVMQEAGLEGPFLVRSSRALRRSLGEGLVGHGVIQHSGVDGPSLAQSSRDPLR